MRRALGALSALLAGVVLAGSPARASSTPLSVEVGPQFLTQGAARSVGGDVQPAFGLDYDFGPNLPLPVRTSFHFNYAGGSANGGNLNEYGFGFGARLTTPIYLGAGIDVYNVNLHPLPGRVPEGATSTTGLGSDFVLGENLLTVPGGVGLSLEARYKLVPNLDGIDPSAFGIDLRVHF
ncbi:MAG: hypothetical protein ACREM2_00725 [Vulcanimicrobiaceae bacterium]